MERRRPVASTNGTRWRSGSGSRSSAATRFRRRSLISSAGLGPASARHRLLALAPAIQEYSCSCRPVRAASSPRYNSATLHASRAGIGSVHGLSSCWAYDGGTATAGGIISSELRQASAWWCGRLLSRSFSLPIALSMRPGSSAFFSHDFELRPFRGFRALRSDLFERHS